MVCFGDPTSEGERRTAAIRIIVHGRIRMAERRKPQQIVSKGEISYEKEYHSQQHDDAKAAKKKKLKKI